MAKQRKSKRQLVRDERRKKKREFELQDDEAQGEARDAKRQRKEVDDGDKPLFFEDGEGHGFQGSEMWNRPDHVGFSRYEEGTSNGAQTLEFFGLLSDSEQEYFRRADELLELNEFGTAEERRVFVDNVFREAQGKELKLASSQSCSRLMERLIQLATERQRRGLFQAFSGHVTTLVTHRFASHCCEQLFLQAARDIGETDGKSKGAGNDDGGDGEMDDSYTTEQCFLRVLDELEPHMAAFLTDRFASHTLRVLLVVLSGRPLDELATRSLLQSRKKEKITVAAVGERQAHDKMEARLVPDSFVAAVHKILADIATELDPAALRILATHPTGNPVLQLLVELEMSGRSDNKKTSDEAEESSVIGRLLPGAPASLAKPESPAAELMRTLVYDRIGSRLLETLVTHSPGKLFKAIYANVFAHKKSGPQNSGEKEEGGSETPPMAIFLRNEIACYPAIRVLERLGRDELAGVVSYQILAPLPVSGRTAARASVVEQLVLRQRFNVLRTLFVRCAARGVDPSLLRQLTEALRQAVGAERHSQAGRLIERLCLGEAEPDPDKVANEPSETYEAHSGITPPQSKDSKKEQRASVHGCYLVSALLDIAGTPTTAVQSSLLALSAEQLVHLATETSASAAIVVAAITNNLPKAGGNSANRVPLSKQLVSRLLPHYLQLATSPAGHVVLLAIGQRPSRVDLAASEDGGSPAAGHVATGVPFHLKDAFVAQLAGSEDQLRACWPGRLVWRSWRCDLWRSRRTEWVRWMKAGEPEGLQKATAPIATRAWDADKKKLKMERKMEERGPRNTVLA